MLILCNLVVARALGWTSVTTDFTDSHKIILLVGFSHKEVLEICVNLV